MSVTVTSLTELDAALAAGRDVIIVDSPAGVWLKLESRPSSRVEARESSHVEAPYIPKVDGRQWSRGAWLWVIPDGEHQAVRVRVPW